MLLFGSAPSLDKLCFSDHSKFATVNSGISIAKDLGLELDFYYIQDPRALDEAKPLLIDANVRVKSLYIANYIEMDENLLISLNKKGTTVISVEVFQSSGLSKSPREAVFGGFSAGYGALQIAVELSNRVCLTGFDYRYDQKIVRNSENQTVDIHKIWFQVYSWNYGIERIRQENLAELRIHQDPKKNPKSLVKNNSVIAAIKCTD